MDRCRETETNRERLHAHGFLTRNRVLARGMQAIAFFLAVVLLLPHVIWAFQSNMFIQPAAIHGRNILVSLPKQRGQIISRFSGAEKYVIHVRDLHCNYQIQKNIAWLINELAEKQGLELVGVEGAAQPLNVTKLSTFPDPKVKAATADCFLRMGKMTGAEYYAAVGQHPVRLVGIEDPGLYADNRKTAVRFLNDESAGMVWDLRNALERCKPGIYSEALARFDGLRSAFQAGEISPYRYAKGLVRLAREQAVDMTRFPNLMEYSGAEEALFSPELDLEKLFQEMADLDRAIRELIYRHERERQLDDLISRLDVLENCLGISATAGELEQIRQEPGQYGIAVFLDFLRQNNLAALMDLDPELGRLDGYVGDALRFYAVADQRSRIFVDNILHRMDEQETGVAMLITGGYHSEQVLQALKARGVGFVSVRPHMAQAEVVNPYMNLLRGQKTSLERLMASNQKFLALTPFFAQHPDPDAILQEDTLPLEVQAGYRMMESALKLGYVEALARRKGLELGALAKAYEKGLQDYAADAEYIRLDFQKARKLGDAFLVPFRDSRYFALLHERAGPAIREGERIGRIELGDIAIGFYENTVMTRVVQAVRRQAHPVQAHGETDQHAGRHPGFAARLMKRFAQAENRLRFFKWMAAISSLALVLGAGTLQISVPLAWLSGNTSLWLARSGGAALAASLALHAWQKKSQAAGLLQQRLESYSPQMREEYESVRQRQSGRFMLWPIYGEMLSDLKLAIGILPIIFRMGAGNHTWMWTLGTLGWVLAALAGFTLISNMIVRLIGERKIWSLRDVAKSVWQETVQLKKGVVQSVRDFIRNRKSAPHATLLAVVLFAAARALDYSTQLTSLGTINAVVLFALAGGFLIMVGVSLLKTKQKTEWLEEVVSKAIRIVCAVVLIEVCKFPFGFFFIVFFGSSTLADRSTYVSLKIFKKVIGALSFAQFFLNAADWLQRNKKIAARKRRNYGETLTFGERIRQSFGRGQPLRQISLVFVYASILLVSFYLALPTAVMAATQVAAMAAMMVQWLIMAKNPKITQNVKITILASILPSALIVFSMGASFALVSLDSAWPTLLPTAMKVHLINLEAAVQSARTLFHELVVFVTFMYALLGFSSVMKDQDKVRQLSEAAPERLKVLQQSVDKNLRKARMLLREEDRVDREMLAQICQVGKMILVPQNGQPGWMTEMIKSGVFSMDGEIYFRRRLFNLVTDRTAAALIFREGLIQSELPLERIHELLRDVTGMDPAELAVMGREILSAGNKQEADVTLRYELHARRDDPKVRAAYLRRVLERRYQVRFPIRQNSYIREFNQPWDRVNEKMVLLLKHGLDPHPYFLRYSKTRIEAAAKYLYQRKLAGQTMNLALYKEALDQTHRMALSQNRAAIEKRLAEESAEDATLMDEIIEAHQDGKGGEILQHQPHTFIQRLAYPVRPLFFRKPQQALESWTLRQPWKMLGNSLLFLGRLIAAPLGARRFGAVRKCPDSVRAKRRVLQRYGLEPLSFMLRLPIARIEQACVYIAMRRESGAVLSVELYQEAVLATRPVDRSVNDEMARYFQRRVVVEKSVENGEKGSPGDAVPESRADRTVEAWQELEQLAPPGLLRQERGKERGWQEKMWQPLFKHLVLESPQTTVVGTAVRTGRDGMVISRVPVLLLRSLLYAAALLPARGPAAGETPTLLLALQRQKGLPDALAVQWFRRQTSLDLQPLSIRDLRIMPKTGHRSLSARLLGCYQEAGEAGHPTLYVPGFLIHSLAKGMPEKNGTIKRRWSRWRAKAEARLLDLILEMHLPGYLHHTAPTGREQADIAQRWEKAREQKRIGLQRWAHDGQSAVAWRHSLRTPAAFSLYDLMVQTDHVLKAAALTGLREERADFESLHRSLHILNRQGAELGLDALMKAAAAVPEGEADRHARWMHQALYESETLFVDEQKAMVRDLAAYYIKASQTQSAMPTDTASMASAQDGPSAYYAYAMPQTCRAMALELETFLQALEQKKTRRSPAETGIRRHAGLLLKVFHTLAAAQPGDLVGLTPAQGRQLWAYAEMLEASQNGEMAVMGEDLGVHKGCAMSARIGVLEKNQVMLPYRQVYEFTSVQAMDDTAWLMPDRESAQSLLKPYDHPWTGKDASATVKDALLSLPLPMPLLRLLPASIRLPLLQFAMRQEPMAYVKQLVRKDQSVLAALLRQKDSPLGQAYLAFVLDPEQAPIFARACVRVIAGTDTPAGKIYALQTLDRLCRDLPAWEGVVIGHWEDQPGGKGIQLPGVLWQPGQAGALGAMLDMLRELPMVIDRNPGNYWRRRYFRLSGQAA